MYYILYCVQQWTDERVTITTVACLFETPWRPNYIYIIVVYYMSIQLHVVYIHIYFPGRVYFFRLRRVKVYHNIVNRRVRGVWCEFLIVRSGGGGESPSPPSSRGREPAWNWHSRPVDLGAQFVGSRIVCTALVPVGR